jgi:serine/threonine-protein kinase
MRQKGVLSDEAIDIICRSLEEEISKNPIEGYEIIAPLGRGAMALVFQARQVNLDRRVALKVLDPKLWFDNDFVQRFVVEAKAAAKLNHPNIVQAYDVGTSRGYHYFAMEYVEGVTLSQFMERTGGKIPEDMALEAVRQVAKALEHAEEAQLVHRDIKPGNIMISRVGVVKLCDLGLAKRLDVSEGVDEAGVILGTPHYISPEQIDGQEGLDTRADIYSLGATLYHLLVGRPPYVGRSPEEVCLKHLSDPVPDPRRRNPQLSPSIVPLVQRMLAKSKEARYRCCADLIDAIEELRAGWPPCGTRELAARLRHLFPRNQE